MPTIVSFYASLHALLFGRIVHAYGVSQEKENYRLRTAGMLLTFGAIVVAALRLLSYFVFSI